MVMVANLGSFKPAFSGLQDSVESPLKKGHTTPRPKTQHTRNRRVISRILEYFMLITFYYISLARHPYGHGAKMDNLELGIPELAIWTGQEPRRSSVLLQPSHFWNCTTGIARLQSS